jgi:hypothetical protein
MFAWEWSGRFEALMRYRGDGGWSMEDQGRWPQLSYD